MRKLLAVALAAIFVVAGVGASPATAVPNGTYSKLKTVAGPGGSFVQVQINYTITFNTNIEINHFTWDASGNQLLDAICVDYEVFTNNYAGNFCGYVGSSSTASSANYDDIPNSGTFSPGAGERGFEDTNSPAIRIRTYGQNNVHGAAGRVDGYLAM
jgi:hypothetical protein